MNEIIKEILHVNLLGITKYKTKFYPHTKEYMDEIVDTLKKTFVDSDVTLDNENAITILWKFME